jgi:hypothetical protein
MLQVTLHSPVHRFATKRITAPVQITRDPLGVTALTAA